MFFSPPCGPHSFYWYKERLPIIEEIVQIRENTKPTSLFESLKRWVVNSRNPLNLTNEEFAFYREDPLRRVQVISEFRRLNQKFQTEVATEDLCDQGVSLVFAFFNIEMKKNLRDLEKTGLVYSWEVDSAICGRFPKF